MQGVVFVKFCDLVTDQFGIDTLNQVIDKCQLESEGIFTAGDEYPSSELLSMVNELALQTDVSVGVLVRTFGTYLFTALIDSIDLPNKEKLGTLKLLTQVEDVIHHEVRRLYINAYVPSMSYEYLSESELRIAYHSRRKLCLLAEGLILGAAAYYGESVEVSQSQCAHQGAETCHINVKVVNE